MLGLDAQNRSHHVVLRLGFYGLLVFVFLRPITVMDVPIPFLNQSFGVFISYSLLLLIAGTARYIRIERTGILILLFCTYCTISLLWGSKLIKVGELFPPFIFFFATITFIDQSKLIKILANSYVIGFIFPLILSTIFVALGLRIQMIEFWNQVPRHSGIYSGSHVLAYQMLIYSYIVVVVIYFKEKSNVTINFLFFLLILSIYCLYQSHTRTALIGFFLFWSTYLWGNYKKYFAILCTILIAVSIIFHGHITSLIFKKDEININRASSGRVEMWTENIIIFNDGTLTEKLLGKGLGWKKSGLSFHNDYLWLLMNVGVIGVSLYLFIMLSLLYDIYLCKDRKTKFTFGAIFISVAIMNFGSNAFLARFELSQIFWLLMGFFYKLSKFKEQ